MNKRQRKKRYTAHYYIFKHDDIVSPNLWKPGNTRIRLIYKLAVKYGLLDHSRF